MDVTDKRILEILAQRADTTATDISAAVNLSIPAVNKRIQRLRRNGVIRNFTVLTDGKKAGKGILAFVFLVLQYNAGVEPVPLSEYTEVILEPFYGSLYYKANQSRLLQADTVYAYEPPGDVHLYLERENVDSLDYRGFEQSVVTRIHGEDKYMAYLAGDHALSTFVNNSITDGSACLIVKNSNGNPFSYYFTQHYQYVYVLDIRYYYGGRYLTSFVDHFEIDDVIFMHGTGLAMSAGGTEAISAFIK